MPIVTLVLDKPLGSSAEGDHIQVEEDVAESLIAAGLAHHAEADDMEPDGDEAEPVEEPQVAFDAAKVSRNVQDVVVKAATLAADKLAKQSRKAFTLPSHQLHVGEAKANDKTGGFKSYGDFIKCVMDAEFNNHAAARRLNTYQQKRIAGLQQKDMSVGTNSAGGYFVPAQWSDEVWRLSFAQVPNLLEMMTRYEMRHQIEHIPSYVQASGASAIQASWTNENTAITETDAVAGDVTLAKHYLMVLINASDQLVRFSPYNLENLFRQVVPERLVFSLNDGVCNGTGGQINLIGNASAIVQNRATASHIYFNDVVNMYVSLHDSFKAGAVWLVNSAAITEIYKLGYPSGSSATYPIFLPTPPNFSGGLGSFAYEPLGMLLGKPIFPVENLPALGTKGDLILWNPKSCAYGADELDGQVTPYLYFNKNELTFRFGMYVASVNPMTTAYTRADGSTASNIVVLN